jgi:predicted O-methyltransferase YrrM
MRTSVDIARTYERARRHTLRLLFPWFERMGVHVTANHFYEPVPDVGRLPFRLWSERSALAGLDMQPEQQRQRLEAFSSKYKAEYEALPRQATAVAHQFHLANGALGPVDAELLYCMIRDRAPRRVIEVGSGNSTYLTAQALRANEADGAAPAEFVAIEPYPNPVLRAGFPGLSRLVTGAVQSVPLECFQALERNDVLFIDSSHVLKIGSDVQYLVLDVLPALQAGVVIHFHDIFFPAEYPKRLVTHEHKFWSEQYVVQAFLAFNSAFEIVLAGSYLHLQEPDSLAEAFSSYNRQNTWPGSLWIRRTG